MSLMTFVLRSQFQVCLPWVGLTLIQDSVLRMSYLHVKALKGAFFMIVKLKSSWRFVSNSTEVGVAATATTSPPVTSVCCAAGAPGSSMSGDPCSIPANPGLTLIAVVGILKPSLFLLFRSDFYRYMEWQNSTSCFFSAFFFISYMITKVLV